MFTVDTLGNNAVTCCGVVKKFAHDSLLGMNFLAGAPLMRDLRRKLMYNSNNAHIWACHYITLIANSSIEYPSIGNQGKIVVGELKRTDTAAVNGVELSDPAFATGGGRFHMAQLALVSL